MGIAVSGTNLWVTNYQSGKIAEYNATTGAVENASLVSGLIHPTGIAVSGGDLWVTNSDSNYASIDEYNATTGAPAPGGASITDRESATLSSLTITLQSPQTGDVLTATASGGITVTPYNPTTGVLLLSGTASLAAYDAVLASVQYNSTNNGPTTAGPGVASETINVVANDGISNSNTAQTTIDFTIPQVVGVQVDGTGWSPSFLAALQTAGEGNGTGYAIPVGSAAQLAPLPWGNLNQIQIAFNEEVLVQQSSLTVTRANVANYAFSGFSYNSTTHIATWTLSSPISSDKLSLDLHSTGPDAVTDAQGNPLDGDWTNGTSSYPSGNGVIGGDFNFALNVLPADTNQDGIVNGQDIAQIASNWLQVGGIMGDTNGDDVVNGQDIATVASNWLATLPAGGAGSGPEAATIVGGQAAGASVASIASTSSPLGSASVSSAAVSTGIGTSASSTSASSAGLLGLPAPAFPTAPAVERIAAFTGRPDLTKVAATIDQVFSEGTGGQSHALGSSARPAITSLVKSQAASSSRGTGGADVETETFAEQWASPIDDELLATLAAGRR
jgi:hypothetical protein